VSTAAPGSIVPVAVNATGDPAAPETEAVARWVPTVPDSFQELVAIPFELLILLPGVITAPGSRAVQVTDTPLWGSPLRVMITRREFGSVLPAGALCPSPLLLAVLATSAMVPDIAVAVKVTGDPVAPEALAVAF